ncbi:MAG: phage holin family protein [Candidatus Cyclobacteriaceae bacterium M2_1C_046]
MTKVGRIIKSPIRHVEAKIESKKQNLKESAAEIISKIIIFGALAFIAILFLLFASIMLANYLNVVFDSSFWGYGAVAGIYLVIAIILFMLKDKNFIYKRSRDYANYLVKSSKGSIDYE